MPPSPTSSAAVLLPAKDFAADPSAADPSAADPSAADHLPQTSDSDKDSHSPTGWTSYSGPETNYYPAKTVFPTDFHKGCNH